MRTNRFLHLRVVPFAVGAVAAFGVAPRMAHADTVLFSDNFDTNTSTNYTTSSEGFVSPNLTTATSASVTFGYDYSLMGIAAAPHTTDGSTTGLRFYGVNEPAGGAAREQGISISPTALGVDNTKDFKMEFDMWINFVGPGTGTGSGSTQMASFGWGSAGTTTQWSRDNQGVLFAADGDGGNSAAAQDYRAYKGGTAPGSVSTSGTLQTPVANPGTYAAGNVANSADNANAYYAGFGNKALPATQNSLTGGTTQTGTTNAGTLGFAWHDVLLQKTGSSLVWSVDGTQFATVDTTGVAGDHFSLGMFDINAGQTTDTHQFNETFIDNLVISQVTATPEPSTWAMMALGVAAIGMIGLRRKKNEGEENFSSDLAL